MTPSDDIAARLRAALSGLRSHELRDIHRHLTRNLRPFLEQLAADAGNPAPASTTDDDHGRTESSLPRVQATAGVLAPGRHHDEPSQTDRSNHTEGGGPDRHLGARRERPRIPVEAAQLASLRGPTACSRRSGSGRGNPAEDELGATVAELDETAQERWTPAIDRSRTRRPVIVPR
ncbi:hypothetical protein [Actinoalloteichus hymeniacidonis]|nr:hypothetical protein [Actinoalloteichus hymeniacidonis]MBB5910728.1 hypothetical protein [Actinoalloteichus hymeniacidonis]